LISSCALVRIGKNNLKSAAHMCALAKNKCLFEGAH
jgi:hypothetical protein